MRLEVGAEQERVDAGELFEVAPHFDRLTALQLRNCEVFFDCNDGVRLLYFGPAERSATLDGLITREITSCDSLQRKLVETSKINLCEIDRLAQLADITL